MEVELIARLIKVTYGNNIMLKWCWVNSVSLGMEITYSKANRTSICKKNYYVEVILNEIGLYGLGNSTYWKASKSFMYKRYYVEVTVKEIGIFGHGNNTYCKAKKSCIWKQNYVEVILNELGVIVNGKNLLKS